MKVPTLVLWELFISIIIYLDDILLIAASRQELLIARDMLRFLLQNLEFLINTQNLILDLTSSLKYE